MPNRPTTSTDNYIFFDTAAEAINIDWLPDLIALELDSNGIVTNISKAGAAFLGRNITDIKGTNWFEEFVPTYSRQTALKDTFDNMENNKDKSSLPLQYVVKGRDENRMVRWKKTVIQSHGDTRLVLVGMDVSDLTPNDRPAHGEPEHLSGEDDREFRSVADSAPAILWLTNRFHKCTFLSRSWYEFIDQRVDDSHPIDWVSMAHPDDREQVTREFLKAAHQRAVFRSEYRLQTAQNEYRWVLNIGHPRLDQDGIFLGYVGSILDIHERKCSEEHLQRAHALIKGITSGTGDMIAAEDADFRYIFFNDAYRAEFKKLWGMDIEIGTSMADALSPWPTQRQKAMDLWRRSLEGESFTIREAFGPDDARKQFYDLHFSPVCNERGHQIGAAHIMRNV
jgi:PAS domain S-box-containing protein